MADSVNVQPDKIRAHAANVAKLADPLGLALGAAQAVSVPSDAFGQLCSFLPPLFVDAVETGGVAAITAAIEAVQGDVEKLGKVVDGFVAQDSARATKLKAVDGGR